MSTKTIAHARIAVDEFKRLIAPELLGQIRLSDPYYMVDCPARKAHWPPTSYGEVWSGGPWSGVYLIFDRSDVLLYVGKAVSIGTRMNAYFQGRDASRVVDTRLAEKDAGIVRIVALNDDGSGIHYLAPALEWFLISKLGPPCNTHYRAFAEDSEPIGRSSGLGTQL